MELTSHHGINIDNRFLYFQDILGIPANMRGGYVLCEEKQKAFYDCTPVTVNAIPNDLEFYDYYYIHGKFVREFPVYQAEHFSDVFLCVQKNGRRNGRQCFWHGQLKKQGC